MCGLHHQESFPDEVEVGWRLAHAYWCAAALRIE
jgi:hypothetical protein